MFVLEFKETGGCFRSGMGIMLGVRAVPETEADATRGDAEDG